MIPRILVIAGSDSGAGAGIQADIKTVMALGGYATTAITAITAQNTIGISSTSEIPTEMISAQITSVLDDIGADCIKTGMLCNGNVIRTIAETISNYHGPLIIDPVLSSKAGVSLLQLDAIDSLKKNLIPRATLITPNIPEAQLLTGMEIITVADMKRAATELLKLGAHAVLLKGGHLTGDHLCNVLATPETIELFESTRINTPHTHGTGCTLASAIAVGLARKQSLTDSITYAGDYVRQAILHAPGFGRGSGPMGHGWNIGHTMLP